MTARITAWLQVVGNFGLIIGLVLVAIQINQNSNLSRAQLAHDAWLSSAANPDSKYFSRLRGLGQGVQDLEDSLRGVI